MSDGYNFKELRAQMLARSVSQDWDVARLEWRLSSITEADSPETCLCGHYPIIEICTLVNIENGQSADVGNVCVNRFMGIDSKKVFDGVKRVRKYPEKSLTVDALQLLRKQNVISERDLSFYLDIRRKRNLSPAQLKWKMDINTRAVRGLKRVPLRD